MRGLIAWLFRCREDGCMLHRWHRNAHYCRWENGTWQMWCDEVDFAMDPRPGVTDEQARAFMETFVPIAHRKADAP